MHAGLPDIFARCWEYARAVLNGMPQVGSGTVLTVFLLVLSAAVFAVIGLYGARLARSLLLLAFMAAGAVCAGRLAGWADHMYLPLVIAGAAVGGTFCYVFYRWCIGLVSGLLLGLVFVGWYLYVVAPSFPGPLGTAQGEVAADNRAVASETVSAAQIWSAVRRSVRRVVDSATVDRSALGQLMVVFLAGGGVGLLAGLILGHLMMVLWTSLIGAGGLVGSMWALACMAWPDFVRMSSARVEFVAAAVVVLACGFVLRQAIVGAAPKGGPPAAAGTAQSAG